MQIPTEIGAFEAKTHFSDILRRVEAGETFTITRHGKHVAEIHSPRSRDEKERLRQQAFDNLEAFRKKYKHIATVEEWIEWKNEGRR